MKPLDVDGRPALALSQTEGWLREELLLDRETYTYLDRRARRHESERIATAIVDEPGERP